MGPFCSLCNASADVSSPGGPHSAPMGRMFYVGATQGAGSGAVAHCEDCGWSGLWVWLLWVAVSVFVVLSHTAVYVLRRHAASSRGLLARWANFVRLAFQVSSGDIKLIVAFLLIATSIGDVYDIEFPRQTQQLLTLLRVPISLGLDSVFEGYLFQCIGLDGYLSHAALWMCLPWYLYTLIWLAAALWRNVTSRRRAAAERLPNVVFYDIFLTHTTGAFAARSPRKTPIPITRWLPGRFGRPPSRGHLAPPAQGLDLGRHVMAIHAFSLFRHPRACHETL